MKRWDTSSTIDIHRCGRLGGYCFVRFISSSRKWEFIHFLCRSQWFLGAVAASCETIGELPVLGKWHQLRAGAQIRSGGIATSRPTTFTQLRGMPGNRRKEARTLWRRAARAGEGGGGLSGRRRVRTGTRRHRTGRSEQAKSDLVYREMVGLLARGQGQVHGVRA